MTRLASAGDDTRQCWTWGHGRGPKRKRRILSVGEYLSLRVAPQEPYRCGVCGAVHQGNPVRSTNPPNRSNT